MRDVFVDVDTQRDFCDPEGALYVQGAPRELFRKLTRVAMVQGVPILGSVDSHAFDAWEFASNDNAGPQGEAPGFPDHCVKGTAGWLKTDGSLPQRFRFIPDVPDAAADHAAVVAELATGRAQAVYFEKEVYSVFANLAAERFVAALVAALGGEVRFWVYGVATDYCVAAAALGLQERGYRTTLLTDCVAAVTTAGGERALAELGAAGVDLATSAQWLKG